MNSMPVKRRILIVLSLTVLLATPSVAATLADATRLIERRDYAAAEPVLRDILARGDDPQAEYLLGFLLLETYRNADAEEHLRRAVAARPQEHHWLMVLAKSQLEQGKNVAAGKVLNQAIELDPKAAYYHAHAMTALNTGDLVAAEASLRSCLALDPGHHDALSRLGGLMIDQGRTTDGIEVLEQARSVDPGSVDSLYKLGLAYRYAGRLAAAEELLASVIALVPGHVGALHNLSRVLIQQGKTDAATSVLEKFGAMSELRDEIDFTVLAVHKNPANIDGRLQLATLRLRAGQNRDALTGLLDARQLAPRDARIYRMLGTAYRRLGDDNSAIRAESFAASIGGQPDP